MFAYHLDFQGVNTNKCLQLGVGLTLKCREPCTASVYRGSHAVAALQALIADKFDPDRVDALLRTRKGPPKWLTPLIADRSGRELIYTLSARYKNCQLLKYAMQRILMAGHDEEVAAVGSRLAGYFEVFHNLMVKRLQEMLHASEERMPALTKELMVSLACRSS